MRRLTPFAAALAVTISAVSPASALQERPQPRQQPQTEAPAAPARVVRAAYICVNDEATRRAFERQYGQAPIFVTAEQAEAANVSGEHWAVPRCMTDVQHARWSQMRSQTASRD